MNSTNYSLVIAEDDIALGENLQNILEQMNYSVLGLASSADEVISMVIERNPDVLLLDLELAGSDGLDAAETLMRIHSTPIVVCTAKADVELFSRAAQVGVSAYLVKPFRISELIAAIALSRERFNYWCCDKQRDKNENIRWSSNVEEYSYFNQAIEAA